MFLPFKLLEPWKSPDNHSLTCRGPCGVTHLNLLNSILISWMRMGDKSFLFCHLNYNVMLSLSVCRSSRSLQNIFPQTLYCQKWLQCSFLSRSTVILLSDVHTPLHSFPYLPVRCLIWTNLTENVYVTDREDLCMPHTRRLLFAATISMPGS